MRRMLLLPALIALGCTKPPPPPPAEVAPDGADITFASTPPGAAVELDGAPLDGVTPFTKHLPAGGGTRKAHFTLSGYEPTSSEFMVPLAPYTVSVTMADAAKVAVTTDPPGAQVTLDRKVAIAKTPGQLPLPSGAHEVLIELAGYVPQKLQLTPAQRAPLKLKLQPAAMLSVDSNPSGGRIYVDGVDTGFTTPSTDLVIAANKAHQVEVRLEKLRNAPKTVAKLKPGAHTSVKVKLADLGKKDLFKRRDQLKKQLAALEVQQKSYEKKTSKFVISDAHAEKRDEEHLELLGSEIEQLSSELSDVNEQIENY
ncbi:MAG: PEGA domain-containing protein [Deltaproteobacteria bacterium]|nr:PEGA domain-containing protein [Deltaproteobacteria bacterium]